MTSQTQIKLEFSGYTPSKRGLIEYLSDNNKLPHIFPYYFDTVKYYLQQPIKELEKLL